MFPFFTIIFFAILQFTATEWQCIFCYYPSSSNLYLYLYPQRYPYPYQYPYPYPYPYPQPQPQPYPYYPYPTTSAPSIYPSIGPCVNGQCPAGYGCYHSRCVPISNRYGPCLANDYCQMGFCYNKQCVG